MSTESLIAGKYAAAALALALEKGQAEAVLTELQLAAKCFGSGEGHDLLVHPLLPITQKVAAMRGLLADQVSPLVLTLLTLLIEKRRAGLLTEVAVAFATQWEASRQRVEATITTVQPLDHPQLEQLKKHLAAMTGKTVQLQQVVDPKLLAGARIQLGDLVLDGTLTSRLAQLRRVLLEN